MARNKHISERKAQHLNPARAQKLNKCIVGDYFNTMRNVVTETGLWGRPECIYNMDEKGTRLTLHKQPKVLAQKGARRVHNVAPEHEENVSIVACGNALGAAVPPMILFKGSRMKPEYADSLPPGSVVRMTLRGSMTTKAFVDWLDHFNRYRTKGPCLLIFDGASSHLDYEIAEKADQFGITLFCLPSNTTHELQPMDRSVFRSFEYNWDKVVLNFWDNLNKSKSNEEQDVDRRITKMRFGRLFSKVWDMSMTPSNIKSGFRVTGNYPFNPEAIP